MYRHCLKRHPGYHLTTGSSHCGAPSGDSSTSSNTSNGRECTIPEHPLAWSSVLVTGLQKVGKDNNPNGKSLGIWKCLQSTGQKQLNLFWVTPVTTDQILQPPPSITCRGSSAAYIPTAVWQGITGLTLGVLVPVRPQENRRTNN